MNIALIGFGGMNRVVHRLALERGHDISVIIDPHAEERTSPMLSPALLSGVDMVIDFSSATAVLNNVKTCVEAEVNLVVGTTGWGEQREEVRRLVENSSIGFLWSSNFSIGVNLYFKLMERAAELMNRFDEYDVWGHEIHHCNKADSPSGTAKTLGEILIKAMDRKTVMVDEKLNRRREPHEIHFSSVRGGLVNFGHTVGFDSAADTITLSHSARNRDGYALGAIKAAEWLKGKRGFFGMEDFLQI